MSIQLMDKAAVLAELAAHPAVVELTRPTSSSAAPERGTSDAEAWNPEWLTDAKFDRGELTLTVAAGAIRAAARAMQRAGYNFFEDLTAVDWLPSAPRFQLSYHLLSHGLKERIRLRVLVDAEEAQVDSIIPVWPSANFYEREVFDLFGIRFNDHPNMIRILLPEEFKGHPLRKDFPVEGYR